MSVTPEAPPAGGSSSRLLGLALAAQFAAFVTSTMVALPFIEGKTLKGGLTPILLGFAASWPVLFGAVWFGARVEGQRWRDSVDAINVRAIDLLGIPMGVAGQLLVGLAYRLAGASGKKVSAPAKELADRAGGLGLGFVLLTLCTVVGAPVFEELFYRGLVLNGCHRVVADRRSPIVASAVAVMLSALWFGAVHFQLLQLPALVALGVLNGLVRVRTKRMAPAVFIHLGFNAATMVALAMQIHRT